MEDYSTFGDKKRIGEYLKKYLEANGVTVTPQDYGKFSIGNDKLLKWDFEFKKPSIEDFNAIVIPPTLKSTSNKVEIVENLDTDNQYVDGSLIMSKGKLYCYYSNKWNVI